MSISIKNTFKRLSFVCHSVAKALGISDGEFWVWYGCPFILQLPPRK